MTESVWSSRYRYVDELRRMGASIQVDDKTAVVEGVDHLVGAPIQASLRGADARRRQLPGHLRPDVLHGCQIRHTVPPALIIAAR